jgi:hypothetical protein
MTEIRDYAERRRRPTDGKRGDGLRSKPFRALIGAALAVCLALGVIIVSVDRLHSTPSDILDHPASPVTDQQSKDQVVDPARRIVALTGLQTASAGYLLMSCKDRDDPPYQGALYVTFAVPPGERPDAYLETIASALRTHGWTEGTPPNDHALARIFKLDAVTVTVHRDDDDPAVGVLRLYGECRNSNDHRHDPTGWVDVTGDLALHR